MPKKSNKTAHVLNLLTKGNDLQQNINKEKLDSVENKNMEQTFQSFEQEIQNEFNNDITLNSNNQNSSDENIKVYEREHEKNKLKEELNTTSTTTFEATLSYNEKKEDEEILANSSPEHHPNIFNNRDDFKKNIRKIKVQSKEHHHSQLLSSLIKKELEKEVMEDMKIIEKEKKHISDLTAQLNSFDTKKKIEDNTKTSIEYNSNNEIIETLRGLDVKKNEKNNETPLNIEHLMEKRLKQKFNFDKKYQKSRDALKNQDIYVPSISTNNDFDENNYADITSPAKYSNEKDNLTDNVFANPLLDSIKKANLNTSKEILQSLEANLNDNAALINQFPIDSEDYHHFFNNFEHENLPHVTDEQVLYITKKYTRQLYSKVTGEVLKMAKVMSQLELTDTKLHHFVFEIFN